MKKSTLFIALSFFISPVFAQDVKLNDSVIFINDKPVALYAKELNRSILRYNMEVYSFTDYILIKAEVIKFDAPVEELKPFYYYELSFPPTNDTLSVYIEDEAFPVVLAKIIRDYNLISNDQLNREGVARLKKYHPGGPALAAKIKEIEDYLDETRFLKEQVVRDRTKPVKIVNEKIIMQDGVKIGYISNTNLNLQVANRTQQIQQLDSQSDYNKTLANACIVYLLTDRIASKYGDYFSPHLGKGEKGYDLYQVSKYKKLVPGSVEDLLLQRICTMIENFAL